MKNVVKDALAVLRAQGIRIPREFSNRINKRTTFVPTRSDIRAFKENAAELIGGGKLVVGLSSKGELTFHTYEGYQAKLKTAAHARKSLDLQQAKEKENGKKI